MQRWSVLKVNAPVSQVDCPTRPVCVACVRLVRNYITVQQDITEQFIYWIVETFQLRIVSVDEIILGVKDTTIYL